MVNPQAGATTSPVCPGFCRYGTVDRGLYDSGTFQPHGPKGARTGSFRL